MKVIVKDVNLLVKKGDFIAIVGANGSGKSTLIKSSMKSGILLGGTIKRSSSLDFIGYVPQRHGLKSHFPLTAFDVALMGSFKSCHFLASPGKSEIEKTKVALKKTGLSRMNGRLYRDLSGGQQQRVLIARALVTASPLLLLDEPCVGMDLPSEIEILELVKRLNSEEGIAVVMVTHALHRAKIASQVAILNKGSLTLGERDEMLDETKLSHIYGLPTSAFAGRGEL